MTEQTAISKAISKAQALVSKNIGTFAIIRAADNSVEHVDLKESCKAAANLRAIVEGETPNATAIKYFHVDVVLPLLVKSMNLKAADYFIMSYSADSREYDKPAVRLIGEMTAVVKACVTINDAMTKKYFTAGQALSYKAKEGGTKKGKKETSSANPFEKLSSPPVKKERKPANPPAGENPPRVVVTIEYRRTNNPRHISRRGFILACG